MKQFIQTEFFQQLRNSSPEDNPVKKLEESYEEFAGLLFAESNKSSLPDNRKYPAKTALDGQNGRLRRMGVRHPKPKRPHLKKIY
jgi:hypothetical protein